jgi:hypothetical protein
VRRSAPLARRPLVWLLLLALGLLAACSSGDGDDAPAAASPTVTATSTATLTATATAVATASTAASAGAVASPYERYHYLVTIELSVAGESSRGDTGPLLLGTVEGDYVAPDAHAFTNAFELGGLGFEGSAVVIGDQAWSRDGTTGPWEPTSVAALFDDGSADLTSLDPELFLYDTSLGEQFGALRGTPELRAGIEAVRHEVTPELFALLASALSPDLLLGVDASQIDDFSMNVWVDPQASAVVALEIHFAGTAGAFEETAGLGVPADAQMLFSVEFEASQLNDPAITIEPPR